MLGPIFDDFYHIQRACTFLADHPGHRYLISFVTCVTGESLLVTRLLSLFCILLSSFLLVKLFFDSEKGSEGSGSLTLSVLPALHPLVLFPFFYASQFSTSVTICWALVTVVTLGLLSGEKVFTRGAKPLPIFGLFLGCLVLLITGNLLRFEAFYYVFFILIAQGLHRFIGSSLSLRHGFRVYGKRDYYAFVCFGVLFFLTSKVLLLWLPGLKSFTAVLPSFDNIVSLFISAAHALDFAGEGSVGTMPFYPKDSHYPVQIWSVFLYFKAFFLPHTASFFGSWIDWWEIHQDSSQQHLLLGSGGLFLVFSGFVVLLPKLFPSALRYFVAGMLTFALTSYSVSIVPRLDWYFLSRAYLPALLAAPFFITAFRLQEPSSLNRRNLVLGVLAVFTLHSGYFHYASNERFIAFETTKGKSHSPQPFLLQGDRLFLEKRFAESRESYRSAHEIVPPEAVSQSVSAQKYWMNSTYGLYQTSAMLRDSRNASRYAAELMNSPSFIATSVCLQEPSVPITKCLSKARRNSFCGYYRSPYFRPDFGFHRLRIPAEKYCALS